MEKSIDIEENKEVMAETEPAAEPAEAGAENAEAIAEAAGEETFVVGRIEAGTGIVRYENEGSLL